MPRLTGAVGGSNRYSSLTAVSAASAGRGAAGDGYRSLLRAALDDDLELLVRRQARAGRDEATHDDVLLEAAEVVGLAADGRLGEHLGGLLEGRGADERLGREARLRDAEEQRLGDRRAGRRAR